MCHKKDKFLYNLGAKKGAHSMLLVYFTILDLPPTMLSKIDSWFLSTVARSKMIKDQHAQVYKPLIEDLLEFY